MRGRRERLRFIETPEHGPGTHARLFADAKWRGLPARVPISPGKTGDAPTNVSDETSGLRSL